MKVILRLILLSIFLYSCSNHKEDLNIFKYDTEVVTLENYTECLESWKGSEMLKGTRYNGFTKYHVNYGKIFYNAHFDTGLMSIIRGSTDKYEFDRINNGIY